MTDKYNLLGFLIATTLVCLPLYVIRCSNFSLCSSPIPFTLLEIVILTTFGYWLFLLIKNSLVRQRFTEIKNQLPKFMQLSIIIFLLAAFISCFVSPDPKAALGIYKAYFLEGFFLFVVIFDYLRQTKNYPLVIWSLIASGVWIALLTLFNQAIDYNPGNPTEFAARGRASAVYTTSNAVGLFLGPIVLLILGYILYLKNSVKYNLTERKLAQISVIILLSGVIASGSRGALLAVFAGTAFFSGYLLYLKFSDKAQRYLKTIFISFLIMIFALISFFFINIGSIAKNPPKIPANFQSSLNQRLCLWDGAVTIIKNRPLTGSGLSGFQQIHDDFRTCSVESSIYPHNIFLNFWTELGIFGLISFMCLAAYVFYRLLPKKKIDYLGLGIASVFIVLLVHGFLDVPFFKNDLSAQFWSILAFGAVKISES